MSEDQFTYDDTTAIYTATWEDCVFTIKDVFRDERRRLMAEVKVLIAETGLVLNLKQLPLLDTWAVEQFAKDCDPRVEAQQKVRQYLVQIAEWITAHRTTQEQARNNGHGSATPVLDSFDPFVFTDAHAILSTPVVPRRWLLPGIIADGLTIIGGSPKGGKSYLAYALAMAVSKYGTWCNHWDVDQGKVIYVSLEDDENDTHLRLEELDKDFSIPAGKLLFVHGGQTMPAFGSGLLEWVEQALQLHQPRLFIIDPISYLYVLKKTGGQFEETKDMLFPLRWLGRQYNCAIVCLDHRRKRSREDTSMVDTLYGSVAKQAVADGLIMVNKDEDEIELDLTIRAGQNQKLYVNFTFQEGQCFLTYKAAEAQTASYSDFRTRVIDTVYGASQPISIAEILAAMEMPDTRQSRNNVGQILYRHCKTKEIEKTVRGRYTRGEGRDA